MTHGPAAHAEPSVDPGGRDPVQLLLRTAQGSRESFGALYDLMAPRVFAMMSSITADGEAAERLTEEAFHRVWVVAPRFRSGAHDPLRWVLEVACRTAHDGSRDGRVG